MTNNQSITESVMRTALRGTEQLTNPKLNKETAFTRHGLPLLEAYFKSKESRL